MLVKWIWGCIRQVLEANIGDFANIGEFDNIVDLENIADFDNIEKYSNFVELWIICELDLEMCWAGFGGKI